MLVSYIGIYLQVALFDASPDPEFVHCEPALPGPPLPLPLPAILATGAESTVYVDKKCIYSKYMYSTRHYKVQ